MFWRELLEVSGAHYLIIIVVDHILHHDECTPRSGQHRGPIGSPWSPVRWKRPKSLYLDRWRGSNGPHGWKALCGRLDGTLQRQQPGKDERGIRARPHRGRRSDSRTHLDSPSGECGNAGACRDPIHDHVECLDNEWQYRQWQQSERQQCHAIGKKGSSCASPSVKSCTCKLELERCSRNCAGEESESIRSLLVRFGRKATACHCIGYRTDCSKGSGESSFEQSYSISRRVGAKATFFVAFNGVDSSCRP